MSWVQERLCFPDALTAEDVLPGASQFGSFGPLAEATRRALEQRLSTLVSAPVQLTMTDNRCSMVHARWSSGALQVRLHHMFLDAPTDIVEALGSYLLGKRNAATRSLDVFIRRHAEKQAPGRLGRLVPQGSVHDLTELFRTLNETWFQNRVTAQVTWGRKSTPRRRSGRRSIRLGAYVFQDNLIRIHPALDQAWVPAFFVQFVLFHEMLHAVIPPERQGSRSVYHSSTFRARERAYPDYSKALAWERSNLPRLLRSR